MKNIHRKSVQLLVVVCLLAVGCVAFTLASCSLTQKVTTPILSVVKDCADATTHQATLSILDDVSGVLICEKGDASTLPGCVKTQLEVIAKNWGWSAVDCAIADIQSKAGNNANASGDPTELIRWRRASAVAAARAAGTLGPTP
jgi:hypothetical protein